MPILVSSHLILCTHSFAKSQTEFDQSHAKHIGLGDYGAVVVYSTLFRAPVSGDLTTLAFPADCSCSAEMVEVSCQKNLKLKMNFWNLNQMETKECNLSIILSY